jgi:hypothetical protein
LARYNKRISRLSCWFNLHPEPTGSQGHEIVRPAISMIRIICVGNAHGAHSAFLHSRFVMNSTSERLLTELRIARAYGKLSSIPVGASKSSVTLASVGNCEIRMFRGQEADLDGKALFWLELFDHVTNTSVDSFRCVRIKDAAAVFEDFMSQGANLNKPQGRV